MTPTNEQREAIEAVSALKPGQVLAINAYAGSGKTTTNRLASEAVPHWSVLYVCYNKEMADAAADLMPRHVLCKTVHALAFSGVGFRYKHKLGKGLNAREAMDALRCSSGDARIALSTLNQFLCSDAPAITLDHVADVCGERDSGILRLASNLWSKMCDERDPTPMVHDGYLKLWVMSEPDLTAYHLILVDESQDLNPVILQLVLNAVKQGCRAMFTGDTHQSLYGYRLAVDAMPLVTKLAVSNLTLTESWRFPQHIANSANKLLRSYKKDRVNLLGRGHGIPVKSTPNHCTIARTNACLIQAANEAVQSGQKVHFAATRAPEQFDPFIPYRFQEILDVYALFSGQGRPLTPLINRFKSYMDFAEFALGETDDSEDEPKPDPELKPILELVKRYEHEIPTLLRNLSIMSVGPDATDIHFATGHRSKGKEWNHVTLLDDFIPLDDPTKLAEWRDKHSLREFHEAINVLYVGITRGRCSFTPPSTSTIFFTTPDETLTEAQPTRRREPRYL